MKEIRELSLNSELFYALKCDFNEILKRTISNMTQNNGETAKINIELKFSLIKSCIKSYQPRYTDEINGVKEAYKPTFEHTVTATIQTKDSVKGKLTGEYALIRDEDEQCYVAEEIRENEQISLDEYGVEFSDTQKAVENRKYGYTYSEVNGVVEDIILHSKNLGRAL